MTSLLAVLISAAIAAGPGMVAPAPPPPPPSPPPAVWVVRCALHHVLGAQPVRDISAFGVGCRKARWLILHAPAPGWHTWIYAIGAWRFVVSHRGHRFVAWEQR